jgi:ubiquinone/menaquinone biosynthesis C-methylase UbiE
MIDFHRIYAEHAAEYDALVRAEDAAGNLAAALVEWVTAGSRVLEVGVGTGRVTEILLERGARVVGCEPAPAMLDLARRRLAAFADRLELVASDALGLPDFDAAFDAAVAGWVFGHACEWRRDRWRPWIAENLDRMERAVRAGGAVIVIETLGTGAEVPRPPTPELASYYAWLEDVRGYERRTLRTDYRFADAETAARATGFFFGEDFAARVRAEGLRRIPECTGLWWRRKDASRS